SDTSPSHIYPLSLHDALPILQGSYLSTGQRCTASSRLIVTDAIHDAFVNALAIGATNMKVGDARAPTTEMGPVVSAQQLATNERSEEHTSELQSREKLVCRLL